MRRADRLFRIVEYFKARRQAVTADTLAIELEVSVRTVYRDIVDLCSSGVPIIGEAGVGYVLDRDYIVRPLIFDVEELDALALGAQMVRSWGDREIAKSAKRAIDKITAVLPERLRAEILQTALFSPPSKAKVPIKVDFSALRRAIRTHNKVTFQYETIDGKQSKRTVRPLCLAFFGPVWLFTGWCETRQDFRNFRLDRMMRLQIGDERFADEPGKRLIDYLRWEAAKSQS
jgi:predicted DNA-binding transcriptional regulator YafY